MNHLLKAQKEIIQFRYYNVTFRLNRQTKILN